MLRSPGPVIPNPLGAQEESRVFNIMEKSALVGTWKLLSFEAQTADGQLLLPYGRDPVGQLIYDALGNMAVQLMRAQRQSFSARDKSQGSAEEIQRAFTSYEAYFGTYVVDEQQGTVTHRLEGALFPNWTGGEQRRYFRFSGGHLSLSTPPIPYGGTTMRATLVWERMR